MRRRGQASRWQGCVAIGLVLVLAQGCAVSRQWNINPFKPTIVEMAGERWPSDKDVLKFVTTVRTRLRERMHVARLARLLSGALQVLSAATAATLGVTSGSITAITALSATSAVMPEVQSIFDAKQTAEAYRQGEELVEKAEAVMNAGRAA